MYLMLSSTKDSASSKKGHSDVQNNHDGFKAVIVLSCIQRENIQPQTSAAKVKAGTFEYSQNWLDVFSPVLTSY